MNFSSCFLIDFVCSGGTTDPNYCSKFHMCGYRFQACPKVPNSVRHQTECYNPKAGLFSCLNRMDKYPDMFNQSLYKEEPLNLNKLNFSFNDTHLQCQENHWIPWTRYGLNELWDTKLCKTNSGKKVSGLVLRNLLARDMGFKGRKFIPDNYLKEWVKIL